MSKFAITFIVLAALVPGCSQKHEAAPAGPGSSQPAAAGSGSAASDAGAASTAIPPYTPSADVPAPIRAAVMAPDRDAEDKKLDAGRMPGEVLAFWKVAPGQKIGELFSGGGYTTELMARIVGEAGTVWGQNTKDIMDKFARAPWTARAGKPVMKHVIGVEQPTDDPFPPEAKDLDAVISYVNYHDFVWQKADRTKLNKLVFDRLKKGGVYGIADSSAKAGSGVADVQTLHRIDEDVVKQEVLAAGFKLDAESDLLRHPEDARDWNSSPKAAGERRGQSDRFLLRFVKP